MQLAGCTSADPWGHYRVMDGESKTVFLNLYPQLTAGQRSDLLAGASYLDVLRELKLNPDTFFKERHKRAPTRVRIDPMPTAAGTDLRAWLEYRDGRKVEVTSESKWVVFPGLIRLDGERPVRASWGCAHLDAVVSANFYDELEGKTTLRPRNLVQRLTVTIDESSQSVEAAGTSTRLKAVATCEDGTTADVSCQASWKLLPDPDYNSPREIEGCGLYHHLDARAETAQTRELRTERIEVETRYGNATARTTLQIPRRKN